ncbi:MAG: TVP38/TMEM64 family protein [Leptolyngbyaceae cyanobacterium bins.302]|nr:TVP38/TMEM64 family protein [Leptolyngbyaceae cyanobacterium bins.302]
MNQQMQIKKRWFRNKRFWLLVLGGILLAVLASQLPIADWFVAIKKWFAPLGLIGIPVFILVYLLATVLGLPNIVLILVSGALFGFVNGLVSASVADTLGAIACFLLGRTIARKRVKTWLSKNPHFAQLDHAVGTKGWKILLLTRLSPLVPSNVLNYGFGCTKVNFWQYCFFSWLGMLPVIALYVYMGSFGASILRSGFTPDKLIVQAIGLVLAIVAAFYTTRLVQKNLAPKCPTDHSD